MDNLDSLRQQAQSMKDDVSKAYNETRIWWTAFCIMLLWDWNPLRDYWQNKALAENNKRCYKEENFL